MARLTEEEAYALDDYVTNNEITLGPDGTPLFCAVYRMISVRPDKPLVYRIHH
jgi:hypothetical protein